MPMPSVMVSKGLRNRLPSASSLVYITPRVTCTAMAQVGHVLKGLTAELTHLI